MIHLYRDIIELLENGISFVLAVIISENGSAPRSAGAKMAVLPDGSIRGTIGGGLLEAMAIKRAREVLKTRQPVIYPFNLTAKDAADTDMICGGTGEILIDYIDAGDPGNLEVFTALVREMEAHAKAYLVFAVDGRPGARKPRQVCLVRADGTTAGSFEGEEVLLHKLKSQVPLMTIHGDAIDGLRVYVEPVHSGGTLYIFGAGHVALEVAAIAERVGFMTVVLDDRAEFANRERFPHSEVIVLESFDALPELLIDDNSYIVIVTRGHLNDGRMLEFALNTDAGYIGMIGSRIKRDLLYKNLMENGYEAGALAAVHSPIGLNIGAETPGGDRSEHRSRTDRGARGKERNG